MSSRFRKFNLDFSYACFDLNGAGGIKPIAASISDICFQSTDVPFVSCLLHVLPERAANGYDAALPIQCIFAQSASARPSAYRTYGNGAPSETRELATVDDNLMLSS